MDKLNMESCLQVVPNRFVLATVSALRAEQIMAGAPTLVEVQGRAKPTALALREVSAGRLDFTMDDTGSMPDGAHEGGAAGE
jgi:DNA-directed RNA polymerase subunit omega